MKKEAQKTITLVKTLEVTITEEDFNKGIRRQFKELKKAIEPMLKKGFKKKLKYHLEEMKRDMEINIWY